jgi:putative spermidine/putrescine transport system permease protein
MSSAASAPAAAILPGRGGVGGALSDAFWRNPKLLLLRHADASAAVARHHLSWQPVSPCSSRVSFRSTNSPVFVVREFTLKTYGELLRPSNLDIIVRTVTMAALVTIASAIIAFPIAYFAARYARGRWKAVFYLGVMLPLWSSYLVKIYAWKLILAKEGILNWLFETLHLTFHPRRLACPSDRRRELPVGKSDRDVPGLCLRLAAVHDPSGASRA